MLSTVTRTWAVAVLLWAGTARAAPAKTITIDASDDEPAGALGEQVTGPPPDIKHPSLMKDKYRGIPDPPSGDAIDDPLARRAAAPPRTLWLGARFGAGVFDDTAAPATAGIAVAVTARYRLAAPWLLSARADWSRRGGDAMTRIGELGASAGGGAAFGPLAVIAQLRGDLRLTDHRDDAAVRRAGLAVAAEVELALPRSPITLGVRLEQGVTALVPGTRDRAILAELGVELR